MILIEKVMLAISAIKHFSKYLVIPSGLIMLLPNQALAQFMLTEIKQNYGIFIAMLFFISLSITIVDFFSFATKSVCSSQWNKKRQIDKNIQSQLSMVSDKEKVVLQAIFDGKRTRYDLSNPIITKLEGLRIINRSSLSVEFCDFEFFIQPSVQNWLTMHPKYFTTIQ